METDTQLLAVSPVWHAKWIGFKTLVLVNSEELQKVAVSAVSGVPAVCLGAPG